MCSRARRYQAGENGNVERIEKHGVAKLSVKLSLDIRPEAIDFLVAGTNAHAAVCRATASFHVLPIAFIMVAATRYA